MPNNTKAVNPNSIRQICLAGFLARETRDVIADRIKAAHPTSMAAQKSTTHIAWHYGDMKKRGMLDAILTGTPTAVIAAPVISQEPAAPTADELIAAKAAEMAAAIDAELA